MNRVLRWKPLFATVAVAALTFVAVQCANAEPKSAENGAAVNTPGTTPGLVGGIQLISPEDLVKVLQSAKGEKPLILNIGPRMLFAQAHIPGAEFIGPASEPQGVELLRSRVKTLPKNKFIVIYCGCCPWNHCPNVQPAYKMLTEMGFKKVNALYIANNFGADWVYKGYPTVRGQ